MARRLTISRRGDEIFIGVAETERSKPREASFSAESAEMIVKMLRTAAAVRGVTFEGAIESAQVEDAIPIPVEPAAP